MLTFFIALSLALIVLCGMLLQAISDLQDDLREKNREIQDLHLENYACHRAITRQEAELSRLRNLTYPLDA